MTWCRMEEVFVKSANVQGDRQQIEMEYTGISTDEPLGDYGNEVRLGYNVQCLEIVWNA